MNEVSPFTYLNRLPPFFTSFQAKHTFWENGNEDRQIDLSQYFPPTLSTNLLDMNQDQLRKQIYRFEMDKDQVCIHVHVEDAAFHDLKALPTIKVNKSCNCQLCITHVQSTIQEMKQQLEKLSEEKAEGSTGSSAENKSRVGPESVSSFEFP